MHADFFKKSKQGKKDLTRQAPNMLPKRKLLQRGLKFKPQNRLSM